MEDRFTGSKSPLMIVDDYPSVCDEVAATVGKFGRWRDPNETQTHIDRERFAEAWRAFQAKMFSDFNRLLNEVQFGDEETSERAIRELNEKYGTASRRDRVFATEYRGEWPEIHGPAEDELKDWRSKPVTFEQIQRDILDLAAGER